MNGLTFAEDLAVIGGSVVVSLLIIEIIGAGVSMALLELTGSTVAKEVAKDAGGLLIRLLLRSATI